MKIYVYDKDITERILYEKVKYVSEHIPRIGEILSFAHFGSFKVKNVAYRISDDTDCNDVMWVEVFVCPLKENKNDDRTIHNNDCH